MAAKNILLEAMRNKQTQSSQAASTSIGRNIDSQQAAWDQSLKEQPSTFKTWNPDVDTPKTNPLLSFTPEWQEQQAAKKAEEEKPKKKSWFASLIENANKKSEENPWDYDATNNIIDTSVPAKPAETPKVEEPKTPERKQLEYSDAFLKQEEQKDAWQPTWSNDQTIMDKQEVNEMERAIATTTGAAKQYASGLVNLYGTTAAGGNELGKALGGNTNEYAGWATDPISAAAIPHEQDPEYYEREKKYTDTVMAAADSLSDSAAADLEKAKNGLSKLGQFGVDVATNVIQMGFDAGIAALTGGGSALIPMFLRSTGSSEQEARKEGATIAQQILSGNISGGIEVLTEKVADGLAGIYGKGAADEVTEEFIRKLAKTDLGRSALRFFVGAVEEGGEEVMSDLLNPISKAIYNNKSLLENYKDLNLADILYDFAVGFAVSGATTATANAATKGEVNKAANNALAATDAVEKALASEGVDAYTAEQIAPTVEKALNGEELTSKEKNILLEIRNREDIAAGSPEVENFLTEALGLSESKKTEMAEAKAAADAEAEERAKANAEAKAAEAKAAEARQKAEARMQAESEAKAEAEAREQERAIATANEKATAEKAAEARAKADARMTAEAEAKSAADAEARSREIANAERIAEIQQEIADLEQQVPSAKRNEAILQLVEEQNNLTQENAAEGQQENPLIQQEETETTQEETAPEAEPVAQEETAQTAEEETAEEQNAPAEETTEEENTAQEPAAEQTTENQTEQDADTVEEEYNALGEKYGTIEEGESPARESSVPKQTTDDTKVSESVRTVVEAEATPEARLPDIKSAVVNGSFDFTPTTNAQISADARAKVEQMGWQKAVNQWTADVRSGKASADLVAEGAVLLNNAANNEECSGAEYIDLMLDYVKLNRALGKGLAAARILKTLTPEGKLYAFQKVVANMNDARAEQTTRKGNNEAEQLAEKYSIDPALIEEYRQQTTDEGRDAVLEKMQQNIADQIPSTLKDKFTALRYLNMLGNLKTQARNVLGNTGNMLVYKAKNTIRSAMESVAQQMSDGKYEKQYSAFYGTELKSAANQYYKSHPDVQKETMGERKYANVAQEFESGIEEKRTIFKSKALQKYSQITNWMMEAGDQIFCQATFTDALAGYLKAHNITAEEWTNLVNEADADPASEAAEKVDKATQFAIKQAQEATFRDTNAVSKALSTFDSNWSKFGKTLSQGIIPFRKTPANVLVRMEEFSPLGFINTAVKAAQAYKGVNNVTQQDVIDSLAKSVTGAGLSALGFILAAAGRARTKSDDEKQEAYDKLKGLQDYSITVGGKNYTADWLTPESASLFMGVELYNLMQDGTITVEDGIKIIGNLTSPMLEMSMLSGVNDALSNIASFNEDTDALPQFVLNSAWGYLSQGLTNTLLGQLEQANEEYRQSYYTNPDNPFLTPAMQKMLAKAGNKTPGIDYQAADYIDAWGRKQENGDNILSRYFNALVNPSYVSDMDKKSTEVDAELQRLYEYGKDIDRFPNVFPQQTQRSTKVNGTRLSPEEYDEYATAKGQKSLELVSDLIKSDEYKNMTDDEKAAAVNDMYSYATQLAAEKVADSREEDYDFSDNRYERMKSAEDKGISAAQYYGYYQKYRDLRDDKSLTAQQKAEKFATYIIKQKGLNETQKSLLRDSFKFTTTLVADTNSYDKWIAAGLTPEQAEGFNKKINTDGSKSISNAERYAAIEQYATDAEMAEKLWEAMGSSTWTKSGKSYFKANPSSKFRNSWSGKTYSTPKSSSSSSSSSDNPLLKNWGGGSSSGTTNSTSSSGNILLDNWNRG